MTLKLTHSKGTYPKAKQNNQLEKWEFILLKSISCNAKMPFWTHLNAPLKGKVALSSNFSQEKLPQIILISSAEIKLNGFIRYSCFLLDQIPVPEVKTNLTDPQTFLQIDMEVVSCRSIT